MFGVVKIKVKLVSGGTFNDVSTGLLIKDEEVKEVPYSLSIQKAIKDNILEQIINKPQ